MKANKYHSTQINIKMNRPEDVNSSCHFYLCTDEATIQIYKMNVPLAEPSDPYPSKSRAIDP